MAHCAMDKSERCGMITICHIDEEFACARRSKYRVLGIRTGLLEGAYLS